MNASTCTCKRKSMTSACFFLCILIYLAYLQQKYYMSKYYEQNTIKIIFFAMKQISYLLVSWIFSSVYPTCHPVNYKHEVVHY